MSLIDLPQDAINIIIEHLPVRGIANLQKTCKRFHKICRYYHPIPNKNNWVTGKIIKIMKFCDREYNRKNNNTKNHLHRKLGKVKNINELFELLWYCNFFDEATMLSDMANFDTKRISNLVFANECMHGCLKRVKWAVSLGHITNSEAQKWFINTCRYENLELAKFLYPFSDIDNKTLEDLFTRSCYCGRLNVAQWLVTLNRFDFRSIRNSVFVTTCLCGRFLVAQWLYSFGDIDIHANNDYIFKTCSGVTFGDLNGSINIVRWILTLDPTYNFKGMHYEYSPDLTKFLEYFGYMETYNFDFGI